GIAEGIVIGTRLTRFTKQWMMSRLANDFNSVRGIADISISDHASCHFLHFLQTNLKLIVPTRVLNHADMGDKRIELGMDTVNIQLTILITSCDFKALC